jgi:hypothetical protein
MPEITITLSDTPTGGVAIKSNFEPAVGRPCSKAQSVALEIMNRTAREWGTYARATAKPTTPATSAQVNHDQA